MFKVRICLNNESSAQYRRLVFSDQACLLTCISVLCHLVDALGMWWRHISFDWGCGTFDFCF